MKGLGAFSVRMIKVAMAVSISMLMCVLVTGCPEVIDESLGWRKYPEMAKDLDGDMPDDVVRHFIEAARSNDYARAQSYWFGASKGVGDDIPFPEYCKAYQQLKTYTVEAPKTGKPGVYIVNLNGVTTNGAAFKYLQCLRNVNGYWRISRGYEW